MYSHIYSGIFQKITIVNDDDGQEMKSTSCTAPENSTYLSNILKTELTEL